MQDTLRPRDLCEEHIIAAIGALTNVLGASLAPLRDRVAAQAERRRLLAEAARAVAAAQAANEGPTPRPAAPAPSATPPPGRGST